MKKLILSSIFAITALALPAFAQTLSFELPGADSNIRFNDANKLYFKGSCSAEGEVVYLKFGNQLLSTTCTNSAWIYSNVSVVTLEDGPIDFTASYSRFPAVSVARRLLKDTLLPMLVIDNPQNGTSINPDNYATFKVDGKCGEVGQPVHVSAKPALSEGPVITAQVSCPISRTFSMSINLGSLGDGDIQLIARHSDAAGNEVRYDSSYYKDVVSATIGMDALPSAINLSNAAMLIPRGTCNKEQSYIYLDVTVGSYAQSLTTLCKDGRWAFNSLSLGSGAVPDGQVSFRATLFNQRTGLNTSNTVTVLKDVVVPSLELSDPKSGFIMTQATGTNLSVSGSCSESSRVVSIGGAVSGTANCVNGQYSATLSYGARADGNQSLIVTHKDAAGNETTRSLTFLKDTSPPTLSFTGPASTKINAANAASATFSGACSEHGAFATPVVLTISGGGSSFNIQSTCSNGAYSITTSLTTIPDGTFSVVANHSDQNGNVAPAVTRQFTKDVVVPTLAVTSPSVPSDGKIKITAQNKSSINFGGSCSENSATITASGAISGSTSCANGQWSLSGAALANAAEGDLQVTFKISDAVANEGILTLGFLKDSVLPTLSFTLPSSNIINASSAQSITFSGACSEFGEFAQPVVLSGSVTGSATCANGAWSITSAVTSLPDGAVVVTASHADKVGNAAPSVTKNLTKDVTPPTLNITSPSVPSDNKIKITAANKSSINFGGTCSEASAAITASGAMTGSATCTNGAWSMSGAALANAAEGDLQVTFKITDAVNNEGIQTLGFLKDTVLPTLSFTAPSSNIINATSAQSITFSGACSEHGTFAQPVVLSGSVSGSATCSNGAWSITSSMTSLPDGSVSVTASHKDKVGNSAPSITKTFTKDVTPPTLQIVSPSLPSDGKFKVNIANQSSVVMSGTCSEVGPITASGAFTGSTNCSGGNWSLAAPGLASAPEGDLTVSLKIQDAAGNSGIQTYGFFKDTIAPTLTSVSPLKINIASSAQATLSGTCSEHGEFGQPVEISGAVTGTAICNAGGTWSAAFAKTAFAEGTTTVNLRHVDKAGNEKLASVSVIKDAVAPTLSAVSNLTAVNIANQSTFRLSGACSEADRAVVISGALSASTTCASGNWSVAPSLLGLPDGNLALSVSHADEAGNVASQSLSVLKDTSAPGLSITSPTEGEAVPSNSSLSLSGYCSEANSQVSISGSLTGTAACSGSAWSLTVTSGGTSGEQTVVATIADSAGNSATVSRKFSISGSAISTLLTSQTLNSTGGGYCDTKDGSAKCWGVSANIQTTLDAQAMRTEFTNARLYKGSSGMACYLLDNELRCRTPATHNINWTLFTEGVQDFAVGTYHACAIVNGALYCWYTNGVGSHVYLGNGPSTYFSNGMNPQLIIDRGVTSISAGLNNTCAVVDEKLKCWGVIAGATYPTPTDLVSSGVKQVSTAPSHTCFVHKDVGGAGDRLSCFGSNNQYGQLGDGTTVAKTTPKLLNLTGVKSVAVENGRTCAISGASDSLYCWGYNLSAAVGDGSTVNALTPKLVISQGVTEVALNTGSSTCARAQDKTYCWGFNEHGQLGNQRYILKSPTQLITGGVMKAATTSQNGCAIVNNALKCWGANLAGQVGDNSIVPSYSIKTIISSNVSDVAMSETNTCAIVGGAVSCWGSSAGRIPKATTITSAARKVVAGKNFACSVVDDQLYCVGLGGSNYFNYSSTAALVIASGVQDVAAGDEFICAAVSGSMMCWGNNLYKSLGSSIASTQTPTVIIPSGVLSVSASYRSACAVREGGSLDCWGGNHRGEVGDGKWGSTYLTRVVGNGVSNVVVGADSTCALRSGELLCWGRSQNGHTIHTVSSIGDGEILGSAYPKPIGLNNVAAISNSCAITAAGALHCWGKNDYGAVNPIFRQMEFTPQLVNY